MCFESNPDARIQSCRVVRTKRPSYLIARELQIFNDYRPALERTLSSLTSSSQLLRRAVERFAKIVPFRINLISVYVHLKTETER